MATYIRSAVLLLCLVIAVNAVNRDDFKTCEQSSFCRRCRKMEPGKTAYQLREKSVALNDSVLYADLYNKDTGVTYALELTALKESFRLRANEKEPRRPRYEVKEALKGPPETARLNLIEKTTDRVSVSNGKGKAILYYDPFKVDIYSDGQLVISANARGLMRLEHLREKNESASTEEPTEEPEVTKTSTFPGDGAENDPGAWEENFKSHRDSKPYGPEAIALDFSFPGAENAYGIPEHADSHALKSTVKTDPYRLYNLDVFEYEVNERMALYGAIPVLYAHGPERTSGVFWHNAAETWVDILSNADNNVVDSLVSFVSGPKKPQVDAHFMSESGVLDVFFLLGPRPMDVFKQYTDLTGTGNLPQMFTLGYHQSRWNYVDQEDVAAIADGFDVHDIPMDVMWLDIEYTDSKKYFTWNAQKFSNPLEMVHNLTTMGRKLVVIIDPHIKRDSNYFLHNDATSLGYYVKTPEGKDYEGWCWPGASSYLDFFDPKVRDYYADLYSLEKFHGTTNDVYIWNDMNEPSVFNGPEVTMPKDLIHHGDWEHRDVHNINGLYHTMATYEALYKRSGGSLRPFILTRSFFAGSQRFAAIWTGDNSGEWSHLRISYPMCLSVSIAGMAFCGADVGGFFKNPDSELFIRWNQAGAWLSFFRQHSHIETKRREPWTFNDETTQIVREALRMRYSYLPLWYTLFKEHENVGSPVMRPLWAHYPTENAVFGIDDEILIGDSILVRPVLEPSVSEVKVYFPGEGKVVWYDVDTMQPHKQPGLVSIPVTLHKIPVYQRGGSIVPRKMRIRRSTVAMKNDPYTLVVIADHEGKANGTLYIDDEVSFEYRHGKYLYLRLNFDGEKLVSSFISKRATYDTKSWLERVDIANPPLGVKSARLVSQTLGKVALEAKYNPNNNVLTLRKPGVNMGEEWTIELVS